MGFNFRTTSLLILATLFPLVTQGTQPSTEHFPPESKAIFGMVVLGKTTLGEFATDVEMLGCALDEENDSISVNSDCLNVAGNPKISIIANPNIKPKRPVPPSTVTFQNPLLANGIIECISMDFDKDTNQEFNWQDYLDGLRLLWGNPSLYRSSDVNPEKLALWRRKGIVISLAEKKDGSTNVTYSTPARIDRIWMEKKALSQGKSKSPDTP